MAKSYRERTEELIRKAKEDFRRKKLAEYMGAKHGDRAVEGPDEEWQHEQPGGDFGSVAPSGWDDPMPEGMSSIPTVHEYDNIEREIEAKRLEKANRKQDKEEEGTSGEEPIVRLDVLRKDGKITYRQGSRTWLEDPPEGTSGVEGASGEQGESVSAMDEFEAEAKASDGFIEEKPQPTFEEQQQAEEKEAAEPMPDFKNEILSDAEAQALSDSFTSPSFDSEEKEQEEPYIQPLGDRERSDKEDARREEEENEAALQKLRDEITFETTPEYDAEIESLKDRKYAEVGRKSFEEAGIADDTEEEYTRKQGEYNSPKAVAERKQRDEELDAENAVLAQEQQADLAARQAEYDAETPNIIAQDQAAHEKRLENPNHPAHVSPEEKAEIETYEGMIRDQAERDKGVSRAQQTANESTVLQRYREEQAAKQAQRDDERRRGTHRYIGDQAYEDDIRVAKEAQARIDARKGRPTWNRPSGDYAGSSVPGIAYPGGASKTGEYERSAIEPPMTNKKGEKLPSITYDPSLSTVENVVVDGVIVDRIVRDIPGVREGREAANQKRAGKVWVVPTKHGFRLGSQEAAGQGPGHWVRPDQAERMVATVADRQEREDEVTELKRLRNRTPLEVREDQLREQREHEEELKRIEFDQDDDLEDQAKKEMEIKRLQTLLAQPGLTVAQRRLYQQQLNTLLGAAPVGAGAGGEPMTAADAGITLQAEDPGLYETLENDIKPMFEPTFYTDEEDLEDAYFKIKGLMGGKINKNNIHQVGPLIWSYITNTDMLHELERFATSGESDGNTTHQEMYELFQALKEGRMPNFQGVKPEPKKNQTSGDQMINNPPYSGF